MRTTTGLLALTLLLLPACGDDEGGGWPAGLTPPATGGAVPASVDCAAPTGSAYYVSPGGDDAAAGTREAPWRTLARATEAAQAGDAVYLLEGTYDEVLLATDRGSADAPTVIAAAPGIATRPVLDGALVADAGDGLVRLEGVSHVRVCGLALRNAPGHAVVVGSTWESPAADVALVDLDVEGAGEAGIYVEDAADVVIERCVTRETVSSGIGVWYSQRVAVRDNLVVNARNDDDRGHEEWISIAGVEDFEVADNELYMTAEAPFRGHSAIDVKESSCRGSVHHNLVHDFPEGGQIYLDAWTAGLDGTYNLAFVDVHANRLERARGITVGSEQGGVVEHVRIFNNVIVDASGSPIEISDTGDGGGGPRRDVAIFNNSLSGCRNHGLSGIHVVTPRVERIAIRNNVVSLGAEWVVGLITVAHASAVAAVTVDHNLVSGPTECSDDFPACVEVSGDPGNLQGDPRFVDPDAGDLHLQADSPALDAGAAIDGLDVDCEGVARPQGAGLDLGAYERAE